MIFNKSTIFVGFTLIAVLLGAATENVAAEIYQYRRLHADLQIRHGYRLTDEMVSEMDTIKKKMHQKQELNTLSSKLRQERQKLLIPSAQKALEKAIDEMDMDSDTEEDEEKKKLALNIMLEEIRDKTYRERLKEVEVACRMNPKYISQRVKIGRELWVKSSFLCLTLCAVTHIILKKFDPNYLRSKMD